jgi:hypothetical protein
LVNTSPTVNTSTVHWHGSKTNECSGGSPNIIQWTGNNLDHNEYVAEVNTWRNNANSRMEETEMEDVEDERNRDSNM